MPRFTRCLKLGCHTALMAAISIPLMLTTLPVHAADFIAQSKVQSNVGDVGVCSNQSVLKRIASRFSYQVRNVPDLPQIGINAVSDIYLNRYEPKVNPSEITRTYCGATAVLSDGQQRSIWYLVEDGQGFASLGDNVEFCIDGFDKWYVYNAACSVLR